MKLTVNRIFSIAGRRFGVARSLIIDGNFWWSVGLFWMASYILVQIN